MNILQVLLLSLSNVLVWVIGMFIYFVWFDITGKTT